jgi:glucose-1-phosphate adenylyltransferase
MGIYVFKYARVEEILRKNPKWVDFGREVIPAAIEDYNVQAYLFDDYWEDIGTISAFHAANLDLTTAVPRFNLFDSEAPIYSRPRYLPPSKIHNCEIIDSVISEGCIIRRARIQRSIVGLRARIEPGALIEETYLMGADYYQSLEELRADAIAGIPRIGIGEGTVIRRAIVDKNARIGANCRLVNEAGIENADNEAAGYYIRDRIIIVAKNSTVKDGTVV